MLATFFVMLVIFSMYNGHQHPESVINISNLSPTSQTGHQHISSLTSVTIINETCRESMIFWPFKMNLYFCFSFTKSNILNVSSGFCSSVTSKINSESFQSHLNSQEMIVYSLRKFILDSVIISVFRQCVMA